LFTWSLPFLADKIGEMLDHLIVKSSSVVTKDELKISRRASNQDFSKILEKLQNDAN
jgi:hypothetical protein